MVDKSFTILAGRQLLRVVNFRLSLTPFSNQFSISTTRVVYLSADAADALRGWLKIRDEQNDNLFYCGGKSGRMCYSTARTVLVRYLVKADLTNKGYTVHTLRHTFATELLNAGMHLECLQVLLGHRCIEETRRYARLTDKTREEEYFKAMSRIERGEEP